MLDKIVQAINTIQPRVWGFIQFVALLGVVMAGVALMLKGHPTEGTALMTGAFALVKNEVSANTQ